MLKTAGLWRELKYSLHVIFHPFDGFWDLKHEKRGSLPAAMVILLSLIVTFTLKTQLTGYYFNVPDPKNIVVQFTSVLLPFFIWCAANWCITTLLDGEGSFLDIVTVCGYALTPMVLLNLPMIALSNVATADEAFFYTALNIVAAGWSLLLIFTGIMSVHQFTVLKTVLTCLIALAGAAIIVFLTVLFLTIIQQVLDLFHTLWRELVLRF